MTSAAAASAVIGERSSWLTSEAKRASRSMRACTASAMSLNESAEPVEVGVALGGDARVEVAGGDLAGGVGDPAERPQQAPARPPADAGGQQHGDRRADDEGEQDRAQRALGRAELEGLEVVGVDLGDRGCRRRCSARRRASKRWIAEIAAGDGLAQVGREVSSENRVSVSRTAAVG